MIERCGIVNRVSTFVTLAVGEIDLQSYICTRGPHPIYCTIPAFNQCFWVSHASTTSEPKQFRSSVISLLEDENTRSTSLLMAGIENTSKAMRASVGNSRWCSFHQSSGAWIPTSWWSKD